MPEEFHAPQPKVKTKRKLEAWEAVVVAFIGAAFFATISSSLLPYARGHDFLSLYVGGVLLEEAGPSRLYDPDLLEQTERRLAPEIPVVTPFARPAFYALLIAPLTCLPLDKAFILWIVLGVAAAIGIWWWAFREFGPEALVYCAFFVPLGLGIAHGQDCAFVSGGTVAAYAAVKAGRKVLGGVLMAVLLVKFHLFILVPLVLLIRREWRILAGYVPAALVAVGVSVALTSPQSYVALLFNSRFEAVNPSPELMVNVNAIAVNFGLNYLAVRLLLVAGVLAAVALVPKSAPFDRAFFAAIAGSLLISPHTFGYDVALLLVPILKLLIDPEVRRGPRIIAALAVMPFPYFMTLLPMPFSAGPALLLVALLLAIAWPRWFQTAPSPAIAVAET